MSLVFRTQPAPLPAWTALAQTHGREDCALNAEDLLWIWGADLFVEGVAQMVKDGVTLSEQAKLALFSHLHSHMTNTLAMTHNHDTVKKTLRSLFQIAQDTKVFEPLLLACLNTLKTHKSQVTPTLVQNLLTIAANAPEALKRRTWVGRWAKNPLHLFETLTPRSTFLEQEQQDNAVRVFLITFLDTLPDTFDRLWPTHHDKMPAFDALMVLAFCRDIPDDTRQDLLTCVTTALPELDDSAHSKIKILHNLQAPQDLKAETLRTLFLSLTPHERTHPWTVLPACGDWVLENGRLFAQALFHSVNTSVP